MTILASVLAITLVAAGVGAGSLAYFSDTATSTGNTFTAGTLELTMGSLTVTGYTTDKLKPGDVITGSVTVSNTGNLIGDLYGRMYYTLTDDDLGDVLIVTHWKDDDSHYNPMVSLKTVVSQSDIVIGGEDFMEYGTLGATPLTFEIEITWTPTSGDNLYQGDSITVYFEFLLYQAGITPPT